MPKPKWNLNTIYISERLQESLRPISRCAMTTVVAPMGYGKTTAVNWYLGERASGNLENHPHQHILRQPRHLLEKRTGGVCHAGFPFLREYPCPTDAAGGGLLVDDLCHVLAGETSCYIFIDDFHLLTDRRASLFLCMLANRLPINVHLIVASPGSFSARCRETVAAGSKGLSDRHGAAAPEPHGARRLCPSLRNSAFRSADRKPSLFQRGLVLRRIFESANALRARRAYPAAILTSTPPLPPP